MAQDDIPKAMSLFGQANTTPYQYHDGTGIGLPLVHRMIEAHEGALILNSAPGTGTVARLWFPVELTAEPDE